MEMTSWQQWWDSIIIARTRAHSTKPADIENKFQNLKRRRIEKSICHCQDEKKTIATCFSDTNTYFYVK